MNPNPTALIAEDEPLLAQALERDLARAWPSLRVAANVGDGESAVREALLLLPDVLFFDIRMPGLGGLQAAAALAETWPGDTPFPALVFVTAYDQHAVEAFEAQAVDYLLKPVQFERLQRTVARIQSVLAARTEAASVAQNNAGPIAELHRLLAAQGVPLPTVPRLQLIPASVTIHAGAPSGAVRMVPVSEVLAFDAADKYVRVMTAEREYLIRTPLRELQPQLDPAVFWQVHRGTLVRATAIDTVLRDAVTGKLRLTLHGVSESFAVSRLYGSLFKAM